MWNRLQKIQKMAVEIAAPPRERRDDDDEEYEEEEGEGVPQHERQRRAAPQRPLHDLYGSGTAIDEDDTVQQSQVQREVAVYKQTIQQLESELRLLMQQQQGKPSDDGAEHVARLQQRVADLEAERCGGQRQMAEYSEQEDNHEQTVAYTSNLPRKTEHTERLQAKQESQDNRTRNTT